MKNVYKALDISNKDLGLFSILNWAKIAVIEAKGISSNRQGYYDLAQSKRNDPNYDVRCIASGEIVGRIKRIKLDVFQDKNQIWAKS
jgi:hypothetical protein